MSTQAKRAMINTMAQHIRAIISVCITLYSTRLVLDALGQSDYGIYSLVAGVIAMLGFLTNAMVVTTQRYISYYFGKGISSQVTLIFKNSMFLHIVMGLLVAVVLILFREPIINGLEIAPERHEVALHVYVMAIAMLFVSIITSPFKALFIARENIVYISIIEVCNAILKLIIALMLVCTENDKLYFYASLMITLQVMDLLAYALYALIRFPECSIHFQKGDINRDSLKQLTGFAGWTIYSAGCIIGRDQGMQVLLNLSFGTVINSAYGIAMQVSGQIKFLAQAVLNAMNPQIVKAEGRNERQEMLRLSEVTSKFATMLLMMIAIPLIIEIPGIMEWWLKEVPENSVLFCRAILISAIVDQSTIGLGSANQAIGKIRNYSLIVNTTKVLSLPIIWFCLHSHYPLLVVMTCYVSMEALCAIIRLPMLKYTAGLSIMHFINSVHKPLALPAISLIVTGLLFTHFVQMPCRFLVSIPISIIVSAIVIWYATFTKSEQEFAMGIINKFLHKNK